MRVKRGGKNSYFSTSLRFPASAVVIAEKKRSFVANSSFPQYFLLPDGRGRKEGREFFLLFCYPKKGEGD